MPAENETTVFGVAAAPRPVPPEPVAAVSTSRDTRPADAPAPPPPPAMPVAPAPETSAPEQPPVTDAGPPVPEETPESATTTPEARQPATVAAPAQKADGWQIDTYQLRSFTDAVVRARAYLDTVRAKVDRMQGAELTPQLGTSPVGTQLAKKFDDRLNSADGLRARLAEAMKRMEDFVTSAEKAAQTYEEVDRDTATTYDGHHKDGTPPKHGPQP